MLLGSYFSELVEMETQMTSIIENIEDTDNFIATHLDSVRNELMKMSLFMEVGALTMAFGAVVGGVFGMNLTNGIEVVHLLLFASIYRRMNLHST